MIDRPLVTIPVEVEQDKVTQGIHVCPAGAPEVEARCLAGLPLAAALWCRFDHPATDCNIMGAEIGRRLDGPAIL